VESLKPGSDSKRAFTLIEILITISIMGILGGFLMAYNSTSRRQVALYVEASKIAQVIFRAKAFAITTLSQNPLPGQKNCGYGVHINYGTPATYDIFIYGTFPVNFNCLSIPSMPAPAIDKSKTVAVNSYTLDPNLTFDPSRSDKMDYVLFIPPAPTTLVSVDGGATISASGTSIYLKTNDGLASSIIKVSNLGQVDF